MASLAILNSLISLYYYLGVIKHMYIHPAPEPSPEEEAASSSGVLKLSPAPLITGVLVLMVLGTIFVGVYPFPIVEAVESATSSLPLG